jgi:hypothetical protein
MKPLSPTNRVRLMPLIGLIEDRMAAMTPREVVDCLIEDCGARYRRRGDTEYLAIAGVENSCTGGTHNLLRAWIRKARVAAA